MDHEELIRELPILMENYSAAQRIQLAKDRRALQLSRYHERELANKDERQRRQLLQFRREIAILDATSRNDIEEVRLLLSTDTDPNSHNEDGLTPLHQSAIDNNEPMLRLLLEFGADVNVRDTEMWTPLHAASCCAHKNIVRILIDSAADLLAVNGDGNMPYDLCDDDECIELIEGEMARRGITQTMIDEKRGEDERAMLTDMKRLYQAGCVLDEQDAKDGSTHLHVAAAHGYYDVAAFLLKCGASTSVRDNDSWMPIHAASCWIQPDIIELLSEFGADINAKTTQGETPMELCRDDTTRAVISTLIAEAARKRRVAFGARDSRRQSRKKRAVSKFESPDNLQSSENPFSARGAIRRLSFRDKSGDSIGRLEARRESQDLSKTFDAMRPDAKNDSVSTADINTSLLNKRKSSLKKRRGNKSGESDSGADQEESSNDEQKPTVGTKANGDSSKDNDEDTEQTKTRCQKCCSVS